jgi:hypothetical protein
MKPDRVRAYRVGVGHGPGRLRGAGKRVLWDFQADPEPNHRHCDYIGFGPLIDWTKRKEVIEVSGALKRGGRLKGRFKG